MALPVAARIFPQAARYNIIIITNKPDNTDYIILLFLKIKFLEPSMSENDVMLISDAGVLRMSVYQPFQIMQ